MSDLNTIRQGENFILSLTLQNNDTTPILVSNIQSFVIKALSSEKRTGDQWIWPGDSHLVITDGLAKLEVEGSVTQKWLHSIEFEITATWVDPTYFVTGGQKDVICLDGLLQVEPC